MEDVAVRLQPFLEQHLYPDLRGSRRPLVVAHGNTIRALDEILRRGEGERLEDPHRHAFAVPPGSGNARRARSGFSG
ncbi:MAG: hypothetical protein FJW20_06075 [Acidimicrobiia bacterium]|nr:hypothetical protein [Acidimicrobiia bacterium]